MKPIEITPPSGWEIDEKNSTFERIVFKETFKKISTIEDVYAFNGTTEYEFNKKWEGFAPHEIGIGKELLITNAYNRGEKIDVTDKNQKKYYIYWNMSPFSFYYVAYYYGTLIVPACLCFLREEDALDAAKRFFSEYKQSRTS